MTSTAEQVELRELLSQVGVQGLEGLEAFRDEVFKIFAGKKVPVEMGSCFVIVYANKAAAAGIFYPPADQSWGTKNHEALIDLIDALKKPGLG